MSTMSFHVWKHLSVIVMPCHFLPSSLPPRAHQPDPWALEKYRDDVNSFPVCSSQVLSVIFKNFPTQQLLASPVSHFSPTLHTGKCHCHLHRIVLHATIRHQTQTTSSLTQWAFSTMGFSTDGHSPCTATPAVLRNQVPVNDPRLSSANKRQEIRRETKKSSQPGCRRLYRRVPFTQPQNAVPNSDRRGAIALSANDFLIRAANGEETRAIWF